MTQKLIALRLTRKGHRVLCAVNGQQGVAIARAERPDLILMDMSLPVMNGWNASRRLKADSQTRHIPIVAVTAHAFLGDRERTLAAGCDAYLTKPINFPRLIETVQNLLQSRETMT